MHVPLCRKIREITETEFYFLQQKMKEAIHLLRKVQDKDRYFGGLYMIELHSTEHLEDKPIYAGTSSLGISTLCMINLHYNRIQTYFDCTNIQMQLL